MATSTSDPSLQVWIEQFSFFAGSVYIHGWAFDSRRPLVGATLTVAGQPVLEITDLSLPSPGAPAPNVGFAAHAVIPFDAFSFKDPILVLRHADGGQTTVGELGTKEMAQEEGHRLWVKFLEQLKRMAPGAFLEIGSRARSGITRRSVIPEGWQYVGFDILPGENVDVVGDAHVMASILPRNQFDAAMSLSVFEHLAMPWKVAIELNSVMKLGGIAFISTHQTFPLHDEPWDFWRISSHAWPALFNKKTGFQVVECGAAEPTMFVAKRWHPIVNYHESVGYAVSSVIVKKIGETDLQWDVNLPDILVSFYPV